MEIKLMLRQWNQEKPVHSSKLTKLYVVSIKPSVWSHLIGVCWIIKHQISWNRQSKKMDAHQNSNHQIFIDKMLLRGEFRHIKVISYPYRQAYLTISQFINGTNSSHKWYLPWIYCVQPTWHQMSQPMLTSTGNLITIKWLWPLSDVPYNFI